MEIMERSTSEQEELFNLCAHLVKNFCRAPSYPPCCSAVFHMRRSVEYGRLINQRGKPLSPSLTDLEKPEGNT